MARIYSEKIVLYLSTILKDKELEPKEMLSHEKLTTLMEAIEEIIDDKKIIVEITVE